MLTVSWVMLTFNRAPTVWRSFEHNMRMAGAKWDELVWCDNGSDSDNMGSLYTLLAPYADTMILNKTNLGVAKGYNRALGMTTGDYIVITGCDMLMPDNWLKTMLEYMDRVPGIACIYSKPLADCPDRARGVGGEWVLERQNGMPYYPAMPIERRIMPRFLFQEIGYFPETFGLYGVDDIAWSWRAQMVCREKGFPCYVIPGMTATHLGDEWIAAAKDRDDAAYYLFKRKEALNLDKYTELGRLARAGWPRFSPFS